ncbi:MAG TPA: DUF4392 domain-containing protein, partial [Candidatus Binatia bacterium]|nr:DUF4392 domain-containing protein [Candidatus Binatia bacterium]
PPLDDIDHLLALDPGGRGLTRYLAPGAALAAARALRPARRVLLVTGFCVPPGVPETDGPPGTAVLGRALRTLGAEVRYLTERSVRDTLAAALAALGEPTGVEVWEEGGPARTGRVRPTHLVAIERPGRARTGDYLSARGESIAAWNAPLDTLFLEASGAVTVGVGDGGNEIGMGNLRPRLARHDPALARIASVVRVRHLVVAGTSNWGAYGVVAALSRLTGRPLLHSAEDERRLIQACAKAGAVDGITRRAEPTVDGLPLEVHAGFVALLGRAALAPATRRGRAGIIGGEGVGFAVAPRRRAGGRARV